MPRGEFLLHGKSSLKKVDGKITTVHEVPMKYAKVPACVLRSVFNVPSSKGLSPCCVGNLTLSSFEFVNVTVSIFLAQNPL